MDPILTQLLSQLLHIQGQAIQSIKVDESTQTVDVYCRRDRRFKVTDPKSNQACTVNTYVSRTIYDLPIRGRCCRIHIELAQVRTTEGERRIEECDFVEKGVRYSKRFCEKISGLCRHMPISVIARHYGLRWETIKNIDKTSLHRTLPPSEPSKLRGLKWIGVDEVAKAKGHDYMTVVYDMDNGQLIWVEHGRTHRVLEAFLTQLTEQTAQGVQAVAMDMGKAYQKAVRENLPNADIVFDRFHVVQQYSQLIRRERSYEFKKALCREDKTLIKGSLYLLLKNPERLSENQTDKLKMLLKANRRLSEIYVLKEQLKSIWRAETYRQMTYRLDAWCQLANATRIMSVQGFVSMLQDHKEGICNFAKYDRLISAIIEAGNVSIGLLRRRARGIRDTEYFKLKIKQRSVPEVNSMLYPSVKLI